MYPLNSFIINPTRVFLIFLDTSINNSYKKVMELNIKPNGLETYSFSFWDFKD